MDLDPISTAPQVSDFQALESYQSTTPASFFEGTPVLHYNGPCTLSISASDLSIDPALSTLSPPSESANGTPTDVTINVETFILSTALTLWSPAANAGLRIPYRAISLHARQGEGVYLQLCLDDVRRVADADLRTFEAVLTPTSAESGAQAEKVYAALSACADLWPDLEEEDGLGGEPDLEGGQWITAENVHEFMAQEDGEENGDEGEGEDEAEAEALGPGAGSRRPAEDEAEDETKWRRTE